MVAEAIQIEKIEKHDNFHFTTQENYEMDNGDTCSFNFNFFTITNGNLISKDTCVQVGEIQPRGHKSLLFANKEKNDRFLQLKKIKSTLCENWDGHKGLSISAIAYENAKKILKLWPNKIINHLSIVPVSNGSILFTSYEPFIISISIGDNGYSFFIKRNDKKKKGEIPFSTNAQTIVIKEIEFFLKNA